MHYRILSIVIQAALDLAHLENIRLYNIIANGTILTINCKLLLKATNKINVDTNSD